MSVRSLKIEVQYPYNHDKKGEREILREKEDFENKNSEDNCISISLDKYKDIDGLIVIVTSNYLISRERFQYWQMAHPTRNFDITITYPPSYDIQIKPLVINPELILITEKSGYKKVKYDSWMLPQSGLAWRFMPQQSKTNS